MPEDTGSDGKSLTKKTKRIRRLIMRKGFTLIELMIVVAIIAIIAAIAIPNLLRSRIQSNESAAIGNLKSIIGAEIAYNAANGTFGEFDDLTGATPPFLDGNWSGIKQGYTYTISSATATNFEARATPEENSGIRHFYADASGVIRYNIGGDASATSDPIGETN